MSIKISKLKVEYTFLRSKVAQRIFFLFVICALLPLSALAYLSFTQVSKQLYTQAIQRLNQANKAKGMTICENLSYIEMDFQMIISNIKNEKVNLLASSFYKLPERLKVRFKGLVLIRGDNHIITLSESIKDIPQFSKEERQHINSGKTLVTSRSTVNNNSHIFMARTLNSPNPSDLLLLGEIDQEYLWNNLDFLTPMTELYIFDESQRLLFSSHPVVFSFKKLKNALQVNSKSGHFIWKHGGDKNIINYRTLFISPQYFNNLIVVHSQSIENILEPLNRFKSIFPSVVILSFLLVLYLSLNQIRKTLLPIDLLHSATQRIKVHDFSTRINIKSNDEFLELAKSFNEMSDNIEHYLKVMATLNQIGIALSAEKETSKLIKVIVSDAKDITDADGSALYIVTDNNQLKLFFMSIDSLDLTIDSNSDYSIHLFDAEGRPNTHMVAAYSLHNNMTINLPDIYNSNDFEFSENFDFDRERGYYSKSYLSIPMKNHDNEIIGVLQLINAKDKKTQNIIPFSKQAQHLSETLASQAAVALSKQKLVEDYKKLFDTLLELIATAIDEKSHYTADHCKRVTELSLMFAEAVSNKKDGPLKDFTLSKDELYELEVSALLHDCGKIITPTHIVDKATKLETIFDRIQFVNQRFEIIKRDKHIDFLQKILNKFNNELDFSELEEETIKCKEEIEKDRDFIITCNNGSEFMTQHHQDRVKEIAQRYRWINQNGEEEPVLSQDEVQNLIISKGTITPEEREVINYHATATFNMLNRLSYPKNLRNVPTFAGVHHERMDGKGYPKGLRGEQIPIQGRILAIADVFEALTAKDRPYKKPSTLMQALRILGFMKQDGHIDPDLFEIFISEKVYLTYANKFSLSEDIDKIVPSDIPGYTIKK